MKNLLKLIFTFRLRELLITKTTDVTIQAFRALFVGGLAFIADAGSLWVIALIIGEEHYLIAGALGFCVGVAVNYILSSLFVFSERAKLGGREISRAGELLVYLIVSLIGLLITEAIMWLFTDVIGLFYMLSKCVAALIAFGWNFTVRKMTLYRGAKNEK